MKIQYCSDLHIEFSRNYQFLFRNKIKAIGDILILAGDIQLLASNPQKDNFLDYLSETFKEIFWLPGNHEYYQSSISKYESYFSEKIRENMTLLNNTVVKRNGVNLIFSTLWGKISVKKEIMVRLSMNDFHVISYNLHKLTVKDFNDLHQTSVDFIVSSLESLKGGKNVVITHHVPTLDNYPEKYKNSELNEAFAVELKPLIEQYQPDYWIYGHSHANTPEFNIGKTKLVTNQLGYVELREHYSYRPDAYIEL